MSGRRLPDLTEDDRTLIRLLSEGRTFDEVGAALSVTSEAARKRTSRLQDRLGAINPAHLVRRAYEQGILRVGG